MLMKRGHSAIVAILLLSLLAPAGKSGAPVTIEDGALDPTYRLGRVLPSPSIAPTFGFPDPGVDIDEVRLSRAGTNISITFALEDFDFDLAGTEPVYRSYALAAISAQEGGITLRLSHFMQSDLWVLWVLCGPDAQPGCDKVEFNPPRTVVGNELTWEVPISWVGDQLSDIHASTATNWVEGAPLLQVSVRDVAPDCTQIACPAGPSFDASH